MVSLNTPNLLLDADVLINWLAQEEGLWETSNKLIRLTEDKKIKAFISVITLMEIRFVLRRKKSLKEGTIREDLAKITNLLEFLVPDEIDLMKANVLQDHLPLSAFDAILLATAYSKEITLVSRDMDLLKISARFVPSCTPEKFLETLS